MRGDEPLSGNPLFLETGRAQAVPFQRNSRLADPVGASVGESSLFLERD